MWGFSPLSATALGVCIRSHLWHVLNSWLASVACERPVICNSDHLCWWNCVHQFTAVAVLVWVCACAPNMNGKQCGIVFHSFAGVRKWRTSVEWVIHQHLMVSHVVLSSSHVFTHYQLPSLKLCTHPQSYSKGDFAPEFFWLQFSCWPNSTVIDSRITNRRTCCPSTTR